MLTDEERKSVEAFSRQIDLTDSTMILSYGAGAQKKMADFSEAALANVRTQDLGEVGDLIADVVTELREFDTTEEKGLFGFFKKGANKIESLRNRYDKAEANVDRIVKTLQDHQMKLMKDAATLDKMYELNLTYFKELTMYLIAGKRRLDEVRANDLCATRRTSAHDRARRGRASRARPRGEVHALREETRRSRPHAHHRHADGTADPPRPRQRGHDGREDPKPSSCTPSPSGKARWCSRSASPTQASAARKPPSPT